MFAMFASDDKPGGKPDPFIAAGIAHGLKGDMSDSNTMELGTMLGAMSAFDDETDEGSLYNLSRRVLYIGY